VTARAPTDRPTDRPTGVDVRVDVDVDACDTDVDADIGAGRATRARGRAVDRSRRTVEMAMGGYAAARRVVFAASTSASGSATRQQDEMMKNQPRHHRRHHRRHRGWRTGGEPTRGLTMALTTTRATSSAGRTAAPVDAAAETVRYDDADIPAGVGRASREELMKWLTETQRLPGQKMRLELDLAEGRGLVATDDIKRGESLLGVNKSTLITVERAIEEAKLGPNHAKLQEWSVLATFLAQQALALENGTAGTFGEYIRALPRRTGSVLDWPQDEVDKLLQGSPSRLAAAERQESVNAAIDEIRSYFPEITVGALRWAFDILFSRLIRLDAMGGELALVPWADMLNHKPGCAAFIDLDGGAVNLTTDRAYVKGEQVWASYGQRPSSELLISYGFAPEVGENPDDEYALTLGVDVNDPMAEQKAQVLRDMGLQPVETFPLRLNGYPRQLLQYASFILCSPEKPSELQGLARTAFTGSSNIGQSIFDSMRGLANGSARGNQGVILGGIAGEIAVREMLADMCTEALSAYPNTLEKDKGLAQGRMPDFPGADAWTGVAPAAIRATQRSVSAARVRVSERRILAKTDSEVRLQLRKLKQKEMLTN